MNASGGAMVSKPCLTGAITSDFDPHWGLHTFSLEPHVNHAF